MKEINKKAFYISRTDICTKVRNIMKQKIVNKALKKLCEDGSITKSYDGWNALYSITE